MSVFRSPNVSRRCPVRLASKPDLAKAYIDRKAVMLRTSVTRLVFVFEISRPDRGTGNIFLAAISIGQGCHGRSLPWPGTLRIEEQRVMYYSFTGQAKYINEKHIS